MGQLFVYGSLRKGMYNYVRYLEGNSTFLGYGYVQGELYTLQGVSYPALLAGDGSVLGEIYEVDDEVEKAIDELEGYVEDGTCNDYDKVLSDITLVEDGTTMQLPVYMFHMDNEHHKQMLGEMITSGDYVSYMLDQEDL